MNINSNTTSDIADDVFRLVRDASVLRGPVSVCHHRDAAGATGKQMALYAFGSLSWCLGVVCRSIGLRSADASRTSLLCFMLLH